MQGVISAKVEVTGLLICAYMIREFCGAASHLYSLIYHYYNAELLNEIPSSVGLSPKDPLRAVGGLMNEKPRLRRSHTPEIGSQHLHFGM